MTKPLNLFADNRPLRLGKRIGKGGEGEVFTLADSPNLAVKIYSHPDQFREEKIAAMIAASLASKSNLVAFPLAMVRNQGGAFVGFSMRLMPAHKPLFELYSPGARKINFPKADFRFLVRTAANVARAVASVHDSGAVIGDVNHSGILISEKATAALIDADSFQFGSRHLCRVGVPEYTPPELQGVKLDGVVRTATHDAFGLSVAIFQLLFMGRHPFVGKFVGGDMPLEKAIAEHRFAYARQANTGMQPPPGAALLSDFPEPVAHSFEAAFGRTPQARPTARAWIDVLQKLEGGLSKCTAQANHYYPSAAAGRCIWCKMEHNVGITLFLPPDLVALPGTAMDPGAAGFNLKVVWASIERIQIPNPDAFIPILQPVNLEPSELADKAKADVRTQRLIGYLCIITAFALLWWSPGLWLLYGPAAWYGIVRAFGENSAAKSYRSDYSNADTAYQRAIADWKSRLGVGEIQRARAALDDARRDYEQLPEREKRQLAELQSKRREAQLRQFLESHPIRRAKIRGIGPAKQATLASYGIDTAAEINRGRILSIPGFGPATVGPLLAWRMKMEGRFVYNPNPTPTDRIAADNVKRAIADEAAKLRRKLLGAPNELRTAIAQAEGRAKRADPAVNKAYRDLEQARVDLDYLGLPIPPAAPPAKLLSTKLSPPPPVPAPRPHLQGGPTVTTNRCPSCGGSMVRRVAQRGYNKGGAFLGCANYPRCRGTRNI
ncbi:topoisomerase DNA-binding C4 zinc finger domain-containing protein [Sphingopyxis sp. 22461]|uniref:topoisomerase DNA-binding C4 zinc finger domain-containing protein n=1 Tax=Sphingopyxis sp. 22461 TaxID=3453923 RepID=UPI003F87A3C4